MSSNTKEPPLESYTIGWLCAIHIEYVAACVMLDEEYSSTPSSVVLQRDTVDFTRGRIGNHLVVIGCLNAGKYGIGAAAKVAREMQMTYPNVQFGLFAGISGGIPSEGHDIRLGDIIVSQPTQFANGVLHYEFGKTRQSKEFRTTSCLNAPPQFLQSVLQKLRVSHAKHGHSIQQTILDRFQSYERLWPKYRKPDPATDILFKSSFTCIRGTGSCLKTCRLQQGQIVKRPKREIFDEKDDPFIHYGLVASADRMLEDAMVRDKLAKDIGALCVEMEAAGVMEFFNCVVIRGVCNYADSHKLKSWQGYAAAVSAAYARELLALMPPLGQKDLVQAMESATIGNPLAKHKAERVKPGSSATTSLLSHENICHESESSVDEFDEPQLRSDIDDVTVCGDDSETGKH